MLADLKVNGDEITETRGNQGETAWRLSTDNVLALAAVLRVAPAELMPWVLPDNPASRIRVALPGAPVVRARAGLCAAQASGDLLDCDCGGITDRMKAQILDMWDAHGAPGQRRGLAYGQGRGVDGVGG